MNLRELIFILVLMSGMFHSHAQNNQSRLYKSGYFNTANSVRLDSASAGMILYGGGICDQGQGCEYVMRLDNNLNLLDIQVFDSINAPAFEEIWIGDDEIYYLGFPAFDRDSSVSVYRLLRGANDKYKLVDQFIQNREGVVLLIRSINRFANGNLYIGTFWIEGVNSDWYQIIDSRDGTMVWDTIVPDQPGSRSQIQIYSTYSTEDSCMLFAGTYIRRSDRNQIFTLTKRNAVGVNLWYREYPTEDRTSVAIVQEGLAENEYGEIAFAHRHELFPQVSLLEPDGDIIWTHRFDSEDLTLGENSRSHIQSLMFASNGDIIGVGDSFIEESLVTVGWMFRINPEGELLWERRYTQYVSEYDQGLARERGFFRDVAEFPDGRLVAVGGNNDTLLLDGEIFDDVDAWVVVTDADGCLFEDCEPGENQLYTGVLDLPDRLGIYYEVFPNPAVDQVTLRLSQPCHDCLWYTYDLEGRLMNLSESLDGLIFTEQVDSWPPGVYPYVIRYQNQVVGQGKIVK